MFSRTLTLFLTVIISSAVLYILFYAELNKFYYNNLLPLYIGKSIYFQNDMPSVDGIVHKQGKKHVTTIFTTSTQIRKVIKPSQLLLQSNSRLTCLDGIVTLIPGGRLANKIFEYASACFLAQTLNYKCSVPRETFEGLQSVFTNLTASVLEKEIDSGQCKGNNLTAKFVMDSGPNKPIDLDQYKQWAREYKQPIILWKWVNLIDLILPNFKSVLKLFHIRPDVEKRATKVFVNITREIREKYINHEIMFIGIHVRRTDIMKYLNAKFHVKEFAGVEYYRHAIADMREYFHKNESLILAFVLASDDLNWCKDQLIPMVKKDLQNGNPPGDIFLADDGNYQSPGHDLITLSMCNHSIISYGTFGMLAAMKTHGRTILYNTINPKNPDTKTGFTFQVLKYFPNWKVLT